MTSAISIHPAVDEGVKPGTEDFAGGALVCKCDQNPVEVTIEENCAHMSTAEQKGTTVAV